MEGELRILIVEDVPADAELALWELRKGGIGFSAVRVETEEAFLQELESFRPEIVITDYAMPEFDGLRALGLSLARDPELPVVVLTGSTNEETAVACMKAGAADYVIKEQIGRLPRAVLGAIERRRVRREKAESEAELEAIYENAPLMMVLLDTEARIRKANGWTAAFAGQPVVGMHLGRALRCVRAPEIPEGCGFAPACGACEIRRGVTETLETGRSHRNLEAILACGPGAKDGGGEMAFLLSTSRIRVGEKPYVLATLLDISERTRARERERRSREEAERLAGELGMIAEIGRLANSTLDIDLVFERIAGEARRLIPFDRFAVNLCNDDRESLRIRYACGLELEDRRPGAVLPLAGTLAGEVLHARSGLLLRQENRDELLRRFPGIGHSLRAGLLSLIVVPLLYRDEPIGVLFFQSKAADLYGERDLALAERIALQVASAIAHAGLFGELDRAKERERRSREEAERLAGELGMIAEIGRLAGSTLDLEHVFEWLAAEIRKLLPFDRFVVNLCNRDRETCRTLYVCGLELEDRRPGDDRPFAGSPSGEVIRSRSGLLLQSGNADEMLRRFPRLASTLRAGLRSLMAVPLIHRDEVIGVLSFRSKTADEYTKRDLALAERIGLQVASAIAHAELFGKLTRAKETERQSRETAERLVREASIIAEISRLVGSTLEIDEVYERFAAEAKMLITFDSISVNLYDADTGTLRVAYTSGREIENRRQRDSFRIEGTISEPVIRTRTPMCVQPADIDEELHRFPGLAALFRSRIRSIVCVPLISRDEVIGVLHFRSLTPQAYGERDLRMAERIGSQIAGAMANAQLFSELGEAEESLRESERLLATLMGNLPGMAYRCRPDEEWTMLFVSDGSLPLTGYRPEELVGNRSVSYGRLIHEEDRRRIWQEVGQAVADGRPFTLEYRIVDAAGAVKWVWEKGCAVAGPDGSVQWLEGFITDISERRRIGDELRQTLESLRRSVSTTIQVMVAAVETRDPYTAGHQVRTADLARAIAGEMGLPQQQVDGLRMAGSIHDIGKLAVPAEILSKPTKLSPIELRLIQEHSRRGHEMLRDVESPWPLAEIVLQHHERLDGSGYPRSLRGDEILIEARILAVADVVEAMASHRPYRASRGIDEALCEIETHSGTLYDPAVVAACARLFREKGFTLSGN